MLSEVPCSYTRPLKSARRHRMPLKSVENNGVAINQSLSDAPKSAVPIRLEAFTDYYSVEKDIGRGKFAVVRQCRHKQTGQVYAAKFLKRRRGGRDCHELALHEINILEKCLQHSNIVHIVEVFEASREIIIVTECAGGGDLMRYIEEGAVEEALAIHVIRQVLQALTFLHSYNLVHLDLKPQNILLSEVASLESRVMLCDLGVVREVSRDKEVRDIVGTPQYAAPEVLAYEAIQTSTDMWSVGVLAYELITGYSPFTGDDKQETYSNISQVAVDYDEDLFSAVSAEAVDFIKSLLKKEPCERLTADEALLHPWISGKKTTPITTSLPSVTISESCSPIGQRRALASPPPSTEPHKRCRCHSPTFPQNTLLSLPPEELFITEATPTSTEATPTFQEASPTSTEATPTFQETTPTCPEVTVTPESLPFPSEAPPFSTLVTPSVSSEAPSSLMCVSANSDTTNIQSSKENSALPIKSVSEPECLNVQVPSSMSVQVPSSMSEASLKLDLDKSHSRMSICFDSPEISEKSVEDLLPPSEGDCIVPLLAGQSSPSLMNHVVDDHVLSVDEQSLTTTDC